MWTLADFEVADSFLACPVYEPGLVSELTAQSSERRSGTTGLNNKMRLCSGFFLTPTRVYILLHDAWHEARPRALFLFFVYKQSSGACGFETQFAVLAGFVQVSICAPHDAQQI